jgi:hypothetical protein
MQFIALIATRKGRLDPDGFFCDPVKMTVPIEDIARFGKATLYGNASPRFVIELADGRRGIVIASKQSDESVKKWIERRSKEIGYPGYPPRGKMYCVKWHSDPSSKC